MSTCTASFIDDFNWAVIRLATLQKRGEPGRLLFATVTLLSPDRPPPSKMDRVDPHRVASSEVTIFYRRTVLKAQTAIDWYRSLGKSDPKTPIPSRPADIEDKYDGISITAPDLVDDPIWPNLGLPMGEGLFARPSGRSNPAPFIGSTYAKVHRQFGNQEGFEPLLANDDALAFISRRLHINMRDYPEYLGSAVLVVPDPIIKQIDNFLIPASDERGERIFYRFVPRTGQTLDGLKIAMFDEQAYLLLNFEIMDIPADGILDIDKGSCLGMYGHIVTHPVHGVLSYHPPAGFLRQVGLNMGLVSQVRKVSVPTGESPKSPQAVYTVHRSKHDRTSVIGEASNVPNMNVRVGIAARQREKAANAERYDQHWFKDGTREEAMAFVRTRVGRARSRIIVADPYFGVLQIPQYLLAITNDAVKIKILTSRLAFEGGYALETNQKELLTIRAKLVNCLSHCFGFRKMTPVPDLLTQKLHQFNDKIKQVKQEGNSDIEVMVLPGKSPVLHDRFLVVDEDVWFIGNSLNTLGDRASMIIKLPNPDVVLRELDPMLKQAEAFDAYIGRRKNSSGSAKN